MEEGRKGFGGEWRKKSTEGAAAGRATGSLGRGADDHPPRSGRWAGAAGNKDTVLACDSHCSLCPAAR
jgi:hypothetical protein